LTPAQIRKKFETAGLAYTPIQETASTHDTSTANVRAEKAPIAAGKNGTINATYNAASPGHFDKHLTVKFAGIDEVKSITLTGDVLSAQDFDKLKAAKK
jgi:hypothetical protein